MGTGLRTFPRPSGKAVGREEAVGAVENFRFFDLEVYALVDPQGAVAEVKGEGFVKSTAYSRSPSDFVRRGRTRKRILRDATLLRSSV
jgi:hypothetical protein